MSDPDDAEILSLLSSLLLRPDAPDVRSDCYQPGAAGTIDADAVMAPYRPRRSAPGMEAVSEPNPRRVGACPDCGSYRSDGRPPYLHGDGCPRAGDLQIDRWLREMATGDHGGPTLRDD